MAKYNSLTYLERYMTCSIYGSSKERKSNYVTEKLLINRKQISIKLTFRSFNFCWLTRVPNCSREVFHSNFYITNAASVHARSPEGAAVQFIIGDIF